MEIKYWILVVIIALAFIWSRLESIERKKNLSIYWSRICAGHKWKLRFPNASKEQIRQFLSVFVDAFMFEPKKRLVFSPEDRLMDIYGALYPPKWALGDSLEIETFADMLKKEYGFDIVPLWHEGLTLGDIFELASHG